MRSWITLGCLGALLIASPLAAQEPDVRDIPPFVMLVVDTSGSMEELPDCECDPMDSACECMPDCSQPTVLENAVPEGKKNRWAVTLEALTGKFTDFECNEVQRTAANGSSYDVGWTTPYYQPWQCASGTACDYPGPDIQRKDGILDTYLETLRFGLMTFDGEYTYAGGNDFMNSTDFNNALTQVNGMEGMWSYGDAKTYKFPTCADTYVVNSGARGKNAKSGALVTIDSTTSTCTTAPCDVYSINAEIQDTLLKVRPYAGTPIAASLSDLYDHLKTVDDPYLECRKRYAILLTDGQPDPDFRDSLCDCEETMTSPACPTAGTGGDFWCPYPTPEVLAAQLVSGNAKASLEKQIDALYVLGMSVTGDAKLALNKIADAGGTDKALFASDPAELRSTLDSVFSPLLTPVSRSVPGFATGYAGTQYQISTGFQISSKSLTTGTAPPWTGVIERRSFQCDNDGEPVIPDLEAKDRFHEVMNDQGAASRVLYTAVPTGTFDKDDLNGPLTTGDDGTCNGECTLIGLSDNAITADILGVPSGERGDVINWMYGTSKSPRADRLLGDIYHSSPTIIGRPLDAPADDAYTRFRDRAEVKERPLVMYIATNDGILHAIAVEDFPLSTFPLSVHASARYTAGQEIWGFVPPKALQNLKGQLTAHAYNLDATPVVKDVYFQRGTSAADTAYHTVLVMGMRGGGNGYFALDVTDPLRTGGPKFLWQFTHKDLGETYGLPEIVQATFRWPLDSSTPTLQTRAVAILSGGRGQKKDGSGSSPGCQVFGATLSKRKDGEPYASYLTNDTLLPLPSAEAHRSAVQCWKRQGRALFFVDVETGKLIKEIIDDDESETNGIFFPSPLIGSPTAYPDGVGTIATKGFVMDADGVLWRIDMSSEDVLPDDDYKGWTVRPFHDVFWDHLKANTGETSYERPILSVDEKRRLVVIVGTGDTDNFEKPNADNRVVSLTEIETKETPTTPDDYAAMINWELRNEGTSGDSFVTTELVTGSMALFEGQLFIATFISDASGDVCEYGRGRLWSVDFQRPDVAKQNSKFELGVSDYLRGTPKTHRPLDIAVTDETGSDAELFNIKVADAEPNLLIQGLGTTQRMTCTPPDDTPLDSYFAPQLANIEQTEPPAIWVVAQASGGDQRKKSQLTNVEAKIQRRITFSRVTSWASSVD